MMIVMVIVQKMTKITTAGDKNLAIPIQTYIRSRLSRDSCSNSSLREWTADKADRGRGHEDEDGIWWGMTKIMIIIVSYDFNDRH